MLHRSFTIVLAFFGLWARAAPVGVDDVVPDQYIVSFLPDPSATLSTVAQVVEGVEPISVFPNSIVVKLDADQIASLQNNDRLRIEADRIVRISDFQTDPLNWGIDRIDQRSLALNQQYDFFNSRGQDVNVWVLDTGIRLTHQEFDGRAAFGINTVGDGINTDCHGHGTHVASTVGGETVGVAKLAKLIAVKVLGCGGTGTVSGVMAGIDYVRSQHSQGDLDIINMSLVSGKVQAFNDLVDLASSEGILSVVAAGNDNQDACNVSPAGAPTAITAAASDIGDNRAGFSNFGTCVDLYGPGVDILGASIASDTAYVSFSGTSMASPHIAGVAALFWQEHFQFVPGNLTAAILRYATPDKIVGNVPTTPNLLVFTNDPISNARCGGTFGSCPDGQCCSQHGWCGTTPAYCNAGCQSGFGTCHDERCGAGEGSCPTGQCCSAAGFCGVGPEYCNGGCQTGFSDSCLDQRCGTGFGSCPSGQCCSSAGFCGKSTEYCNAGCQSAFGLCKDQRCGGEFGDAQCPTGQCCSRFGFCGNGDDYCFTGCQFAFGACYE